MEYDFKITRASVIHLSAHVTVTADTEDEAKELAHIEFDQIPTETMTWEQVNEIDKGKIELINN